MDQHDLTEERVRSKAYQLWLDDGAPEGSADNYWHRAKLEIGRDEAQHDRVMDDSFPASDPPSSGVVTGPG